MSAKSPKETEEQSSLKEGQFLKWLLLSLLLIIAGGFFLSFYVKVPPSGAGVTGINSDITPEIKSYNFNPDKYKKE